MRLPKLVLITSRRRTPRPLAEAVRLALGAIPLGAASVLLREKDLDGGPLLRLARDLRSVTNEFHAPLIVSNRWDVALASGADGVHLAGDAPSAADVRAFVGRRLMIGTSLHGQETPPADADYAFISPIFPTSSKPGAMLLGVDGLREAPIRAGETRVFALGGIESTERAVACLRAGAYGVATLGAVLTSNDPAAQAVLFWRAIKAHDVVAP